jgi:Arabinose-binding domain of AraC transcription regulator, N-term
LQQVSGGRGSGSVLHRGADIRASALAAGVSPELANDPEARISHEAMMRLWDALARRTANEQRGLHMTQLARSAPDNVLAYGIEPAPEYSEMHSLPD